MKRRLLLTTLSLLMCVFLCGVWCYQAWQEWTYFRPFRSRGVLMAVHVQDVYIRRGVPIWSIVAVTAVLPAGRSVAFLRAVWSDRHPPGHCHHCRYDLRATPERCPECGAAPRNVACSIS
jgi:hypothetical protein